MFFQDISKKPWYAGTEVGGWVKSKVFSSVKGGWAGHKYNDFEHTYFMDDPLWVFSLYLQAASIAQTR